MRAFICVDLDEKAKGEIKNILNKLDGDLTANFVKPGNLHLTFKFLGDITEEDAERIKKALSKINFRKFKVKLGKI